MMTRLSVVGLLLVTVAACGTTSPSPANTPQYTVVSETNRVITIEVPTLPDESGLRAVFDAIRAQNRPDGGYFVQINCAVVGVDKSAGRLANGKYAVGNLGAAQTGLAAGAFEFDVLKGRACPP